MRDGNTEYSFSFTVEVDEENFDLATRLFPTVEVSGMPEGLNGTYLVVDDA